MRRLMVFVSASALLATVLLVPLAAGVSALTASAAGFACDPNGTTGGSPTTTLSSVKIDTTTPANSQLTCLFRGTRLPLSTGGACSFDGAAFHVDFSRRTLLPVNNNTNLICSGATSITLRTDLSVTKTDGSTTAVPGAPTTYTITVKNNGTIAANGASVADTFTAPITADTYTSVAGGGATGNTASGTGNIADTLNLPGGASVTYTVVATIDPSATGSLANTATVTAPAGITDNVPGNNSATDTDTLTPIADVVVTVTDGLATIPAGTTTTWTVTVTNNGPSTATNVHLTTFASSLPPSCGFGSFLNQTSVSTVGTMLPGATANPGSGSARGALAGCTMSETFGYMGTETDPNPANNTSTDTTTTT